MEIKDIAVLWDLDGTILDTFELQYQTWKQALSKYKTVFTREVFHQHFGETNIESVPFYFGHALDEKFINDLSDQKEILFRQNLIEGAELFPGIQVWFDFFKTKGAKQAIASSAPIRNILSIVENFNIAPYFDALVTGEGMQSKPAPDIFLFAANQLNVKTSRCVVFEDSIHGITAAKNAGMVRIGKAGTANFSTEEVDFFLNDYLIDPVIYSSQIIELLDRRERDLL